MIKIGVFGAGHLGKIHIRLLKEIKGFQLVGFHDPHPETAAAVEHEFKVKHFADADALLELCDAVDVVTPTHAHYNCMEKALKMSKHVFVEKPLAKTVKEAKSLIALTTEADVKVQVGHVERFNPAFIAAQPYFDHPMFIETHRLAQFNPRGTDVPVVLDLMIHDIDIVLSVVKSNIKKISASGASVFSDTPDIANARIEFDNGCVANLTASRMSLKTMRKSRFFQRDAYIAVDFLEKSAEIVRMEDAVEPIDPLAITIDLGSKGTKLILFEKPIVSEINSIGEELRSFHNAIKNNTKTAVSIEEGYNALSVAFQIMEKMKIGLPAAP
jgi:predicted dehydrogenase